MYRQARNESTTPLRRFPTKSQQLKHNHLIELRAENVKDHVETDTQSEMSCMNSEKSNKINFDCDSDNKSKKLNSFMFGESEHRSGITMRLLWAILHPNSIYHPTFGQELTSFFDLTKIAQVEN